MTHLGNPFFSKLLGLLALHSEGGDGKNSIALVKSLSPLDGGVDDLGINTSDGRQKACDVGSVDVDGVGVRVASRERLDTVDAELLELLGEGVTVGRHGAYTSKDGGVLVDVI